jgi:hypothetical protein
MLKYDPKWRFNPPADGAFINSSIPIEVQWELNKVIMKLATQGDRWEIIEHFKGAFRKTIGQSSGRSSSEGWAESDLNDAMRESSLNAPLFLEAFYDACNELKAQGLHAPNHHEINAFFAKFNIGLRIEPPNLVLFDVASMPSVAIVQHVPTLEQQIKKEVDDSLSRSDILLSEGRGREAVTEALWTLESLTTKFDGLPLEGDKISGKYFNEIVKDIIKIEKGSAFAQVMGWLKTLHGYLSSPQGGGIRHGRDFSIKSTIHLRDARLYCNLIRSYINYLLETHIQITGCQIGIANNCREDVILSNNDFPF